MLRASCARTVSIGLLLCMLAVWRGDQAHALIEIVEEQQCHDQEFRLTCREFETHIAVLEAWYTSIEDLAQNTTATGNQTEDTRTLSPIDAELDQVFVYSSPKHNGFYEITNRTVSENSTLWSTNVNDSFESINETLDLSLTVDFVNNTESCGVKRYIKSFASWKQGDRKTPSVVREGSINLRAPVSYRCTGVNHCSFRVKEDYPPSVSWYPGIVYIKYACFDESTSIHYCNREVSVGITGAESEGYVRTPGYPHFYIGDECRWKLRVHPEQHLRLTFLDVSLRSIGPFETECTDYVTVIDSSGEVLLSSCDQVDLPHQIVSQTNVVEIIVIAKSKGAFPKRGVLLHYKSINCITIAAPSSGYLVYRNEQLAHYVCNVNHVFADTRKRARIAWCYDDNRWNDSVPSCIEAPADEAVAEFVPDAPKEDAKLPPTEANMIVDIVIPSLLIAALFIGNAFIVLIIYKYRKRKNEDLEDEFNTIPLSINGNIHSAGNAV